MGSVLIPLDGSEQSDRALAHATETIPTKSVTLMTVIDPSSGFSTGAGTPGAAEVWYESEKKRVKVRLSNAREQVETAGLEVETVVETGRPAPAIVEYATTHDIDQIVMGSHGRKGVSRLLLGSVAEAVVRRSPVPVTVVP
ncbi:universal stress protein [Halocatena marina]|uniref:Universal stress protein n=1 Tax=Halocatena marina TaxID=2934937 RepID=A0ABD5YSU5_9EURY|nr:universal stress protein [Halocatena marina]